FRVTTNEPAIERLLGQDVKIPCFLSGYETPEVDLRYISIRWIRKSPNGNVSDVYRYEVISGHKASRLGSKISENDLIKGDAGLYIPQVQVGDDGEYTCSVFYTPYKGEASSILHVSVQPTVEVNPPALSIMIGMEKSVTCDVINFYPVAVDVRWVQYLKDGRGSVPLERNISTSHAALNKDGTYNVTGYLMLHPQSAGDDGTTYGCLVKHKSLTEERAVNFTLSVEEPRDGRIIIIGVLVAFAFLIMFLSGYLWLSLFRKVTPTLSKITGNENLIHMDRAALSCQIMNVRPGFTEICVSLKRRGGEKMDIITRKCEVTETSSQKKMKSDEEEQLMERGASPSLPMQMEVILDGKFDRGERLYDYCCSIFITPDIEVDNEAELTVTVRHDFINHPISETCTLKVIGVPPKLSKIVAPRCIINGDSVALTCCISGFKPRLLMITWLKGDATGNDTELLRWDSGETEVLDPKYSHELSENKHDDDSYSILSCLLKPNIKEDYGAKYICRVSHPATGSHQEQSKDMEVTGTLLNFSEDLWSQKIALSLLGNDSCESQYSRSCP
ncbi:uncharacterized protein LOC128467561, partial [Spea bombifrons]|uniref:uncharacterized protein LOC128467561 n=1 Tax=Spea bombifrons TaxID=233779 RepID=UPI00234A30FA